MIVISFNELTRILANTSRRGLKESSTLGLTAAVAVSAGEAGCASLRHTPGHGSARLGRVHDTV